MNTSSKLLAALALITVSAFAQSEQVTATEVQGSGLIGKRYASVGFGFVDVRKSSVDAFGANASYNVPINANVDVITSFTHAWAEGNDYNTNQNLNVTAVSYLTQGTVKPFVTVGLGYDWTAYNNEGLRYNVGIGGEYQLCNTASLTASVDFTDGFRIRTQSNEEFSGTVGVNYWAAKNVVIIADVSMLEHGHRGASLSVGYRF